MAKTIETDIIAALILAVAEEIQTITKEPLNIVAERLQKRFVEHLNAISEQPHADEADLGSP